MGGASQPLKRRIKRSEIPTFIGCGGFSKAAGDQVPAEPEGLVCPAVDVLHQHVDVGVLAL